MCYCIFFCFARNISALKEFTTSTHMSIPNNDIQQLHEQIARLGEQLSKLQQEKDDVDPQIEVQPPTSFLTPTDEEAEQYPAIRSTHPLFLFENDIDDDEFWELLRKFPKNSTVGYEPPRTPSIVHTSTINKAHDVQLRAFQKRLANLTRPVDLFLHQIWQLEAKGNVDDKFADLCVSFAVFMREQLAGMAGRISTVRTENLRATQGVTYKDDPLKLVDPKQFQDDIKSYKALSQAFKPRQPTRPQPRFSGDNYYNSFQTQNRQNRPQKDTKFRRRDDYGDNKSYFQRDNNKRWGNRQQRGRSQSRNDKPRNRRNESEGDFNDS